MKTKIRLSVTFVAVLGLSVAAFFYFRGMKMNVPQDDTVIPFVRGILDGTLRGEQKMLRAYGAPRVSDALFVIGPRERCEALSLAIMGSDDFDNVDARLVPDHLPDFAGETVCSIRTFDDYAALAGEPGEERLRELTVRSFLAAVDTLCYISPYDRMGMGRKPLAKLVVLSSPYMSGYGAADLDSLLRGTGCALPVISPLHRMASDLYSRPSQLPLSVGVMADAASSSCGAYAICLKEAASAAKAPAPGCFVYSCGDEQDPLISFLDHYIADGNTGKLDCLIVDDYSVNVELLQWTLARLKSGDNAESMTYGNILGEGFRILDSRKVATMSCYRTMREHNLFTHNISLPVGVDLMAIPKEDAPGELMLLQYNEKFVPRP